MITLNYLLKPFLGLLTVGGLGTGSYFLYKHTTSKKEEVVQEEATPEGNGQGSSPGQENAGTVITNPDTTGSGGNSGGGTAAPGVGSPSSTNGSSGSGGGSA